MAALGTDKELSDLLDFSAVRNNGGNEQQLEKENPQNPPPLQKCD